MKLTIPQNTFRQLLIFFSATWHLTTHAIKTTFQGKKQRELSTYTSDTFIYWLWKWQWKWQPRQQQWTIVHLRAYCPVCSTELVSFKTDYGMVLMCSVGGWGHGGFNSENDEAKKVNALIMEKAEKRFELGQKSYKQ